MNTSPALRSPDQTHPAAPIPAALRNFDALPDSANVRLPVVAALFACSTVTVWRRVKKGSSRFSGEGGLDLQEEIG